MLIPQTINKYKYKIVNNEVKPDSLKQVETFVEYNIDDFSNDDLQTLIDNGHKDYFSKNEILQMINKGISGLEEDPELTVIPVSSSIENGSYFDFADYQVGIWTICDENIEFVVSYKGTGNITATGTIGGGNLNIVYNSDTKILSFAINLYDTVTITISLSKSTGYLATSKQFTIYGYYPKEPH